MIRSEDPSPDGVEPYDLPRGTCPSCGADSVRHLVIGLPAMPPSRATTPPWVEWVGCVHPGYDRTCELCGHGWTSEDPGQPTTPG